MQTDEFETSKKPSEKQYELEVIAKGLSFAVEEIRESDYCLDDKQSKALVIYLKTVINTLEKYMT